MAPRLNRMVFFIFLDAEWLMYSRYSSQFCKEYKTINVIKYIAA